MGGGRVEGVSSCYCAEDIARNAWKIAQVLQVLDRYKDHPGARDAANLTRCILDLVQSLDNIAFDPRFALLRDVYSHVECQIGNVRDGDTDDPYVLDALKAFGESVGPATE